MYAIQRQPYAKRVGLPGDVELGFDDWLSWLSVVTVFLNASLGNGGALSSAARFLGGLLDTGAAMS
jgi:hypothetical protein